MNDLSPQRAAEVPRLIRMHENDSVAIIANDFGLAAATQTRRGRCAHPRAFRAIMGECSE